MLPFGALVACGWCSAHHCFRNIAKKPHFHKVILTICTVQNFFSVEFISLASDIPGVVLPFEIILFTPSSVLLYWSIMTVRVRLPQFMLYWGTSSGSCNSRNTIFLNFRRRFPIFEQVVRGALYRIFTIFPVVQVHLLEGNIGIFLASLNQGAFTRYLLLESLSLELIFPFFHPCYCRSSLTFLWNDRHVQLQIPHPMERQKKINLVFSFYYCNT